MPFRLTGGLHHAVRGTYAVAGVPEENHGLLNVLLATSAALSGAGHEEVAGLLALRDGAALAELVAAWPDATAARVREAFTAYGCCTVTDPLGELADLGLLEPLTARTRPRPAPDRPDLDTRTAMTWLDLPADHPFGVHNLPYGVFSTGGARRASGCGWATTCSTPRPARSRPAWSPAVVWRGASLNPSSRRAARRGPPPASGSPSS